MSFNSFIDWAFMGVISGAVYILWQMKESVGELNNKISILIISHENTVATIADHEARIRGIEKEGCTKDSCPGLKRLSKED